MRLVVFLLMLIAAAPLTARAPEGDNQVQSLDAAALDNALVRIERRSQEVERRAAVDQARREIDNDANARLQNYVGLASALVGLFALIATVLLVIIAFRTPAQAISAAVQAASDGLEAERKKINERFQDVETLFGEAKSLVEKMHAHESAAKTIIEGLRPGEAPRSSDEREVVAAAAVQATAKPPAQRTPEDLRAVIVNHIARDDWQAVANAARAMAYLYPDSRPDLAFALFNEGVALSQLERPEDAIATFRQLIDLVGDDPSLEEEAATARLNTGVALASLNRHDEAYGLCDEIVRKYGSSSNTGVLETVGFALANKVLYKVTLNRLEEADQLRKEIRQFLDNHPTINFDRVDAALTDADAVMLLRDGQASEALEILESVTGKYSLNPDRQMRRTVANAYYNKACAHALLADIPPSIAALEEWGVREGRLDCARIAGDSDFNGIRDNPEFRTFLRNHGCA